jgi:OOP family OmpA-OmpF porin
MKKLSRLSFATLALGALCVASPFAQAQNQAQPGALGNPQDPTNPSYGTSPNGAGGGMSGTMGTTGGASAANDAGAPYGTMQTLPSEPTGSGYTGKSRYSWIPYTTAGFVGVSIGNGALDDVPCVASRSCDDPGGAVSVYTGGMFTPYIGLQLGYFRLNDFDRNGGKFKISGANISLVGIAPLGTNFSLVGRLGGTYGWTEVTAGAGVVTVTGKEEEFVPAYGVGVSWDFHPNWSATLDWDRHHLKFAGVDEKKKTDIATIGLKYRF